MRDGGLCDGCRESLCCHGWSRRCRDTLLQESLLTVFSSTVVPLLQRTLVDVVQLDPRVPDDIRAVEDQFHDVCIIPANQTPPRDQPALLLHWNRMRVTQLGDEGLHVTVGIRPLGWTDVFSQEASEMKRMTLS